MRVITRGVKGSSVLTAGEPQLDIPIAREVARVDPTGVGDAYRAGFIAGLAWGLSLERCAQVGSLQASYAIEVVGTQEYRFGDTFLVRLRKRTARRPPLRSPRTFVTLRLLTDAARADQLGDARFESIAAAAPDRRVFGQSRDLTPSRGMGLQLCETAQLGNPSENWKPASSLGIQRLT